MAGIPLTPVERVAGAIFYAATDPDMETSGCPWLLPDDGYVFRIEREQLKEGVYQMVDARTKAAIALVHSSILCIDTPLMNWSAGMYSGAAGVKHAFAIARDLWRLLGKQTVLFGTAVAGANYLYRSEVAREFVRHHATEYMDWASATAGSLLG
jgi:hypothetical protein